MKIKIFIITITLLCLYDISIIAQQYQPIPDSSASWIVQQDNGFGEYFYIKFYVSPYKDDTIINDINYTKLFRRFDISDPQYFGAFRNGEDGKSYYYSRDLFEELLLRDFTKEAGDTIRDVAYEFVLDWTWKLDFIVDSTNIFYVAPYSYKVMFLRTLVPDTIPEQGFQPLTWIEKIGSFGGGPVNTFPGGLSSSRLYCHQYNDTIYYNSTIWDFSEYDIQYYAGECHDPVGLDEKYNYTTIFNVFPNPFITEISIRIENNESDYLVQIYSILGEKVFEVQINKAIQNTKLLPNIKPGIYFLSISDDNKVINSQIIIKK